MASGKTTFALLGIFVFMILSISLVSATTIFEDDFDDYTTLSDNWTLTNEGSPNWTISNAYAEANGNSNSTMEKTISTVSYRDIVFSYGRQLGEDSGSFGDGGDEFNVSYYDGSSWNILESNNSASDSDFVSQISDALNEASENNANFKIKFECTTNAATEFCRVDNVVVSGTLMTYALDTNLPSHIQYGENATINLTNSGDYDLAGIFINETSNYGVEFSSNTLDLDVGESLSDLIDITFTNTALDNLIFGDNVISLNISDSTNNISKTTSFTVEKHFCDSGEVGTNLSIESVDFSNNDGDDDAWEILDEIEIEVEVRNDHNDEEADDVIVELGLFDSTGSNLADELEFLSGGEDSEESEEFDIDEDDESTVKFVFRVPADFDDGNYKLAVKAYSDDFGEDVECTDSHNTDLSGDFYESISIDRESDDEEAIIVDDIELDTQFTCGEEVQGEFTVFNIGDRDEDKVKVTMKNSDLGLDQEFEILGGLDSGDEEKEIFNFEIPEGMEDKNYIIRFVTHFDYDGGEYDEMSPDSFEKTIQVVGCEEPESEESVLITAELDSEAEAGEELIVTSTITNLGSETTTFAFNVTGFNNWAELISLSDKVAVLNSGDSKEITITLKVNEDTEGTQSFVIETNSNGNLEVQQVEVSVAESTGLFSGFGSILKNSGMLWLIGIINVVLIFLIILVAVRLSRR